MAIDLKVKVTEKDSGWDKLAADLAAIRRKSVVSGVQAEEDSELLTIANANEFGADIDHPGGTPYIILEGGMARFVKKGTADVAGVTKPHKIIIPSRPFIRQTFSKNEKKLAKLGFKLGRLVVDGKLTIDQALENWGDQFVAMVRSEVADGSNFEANAPATIRAKGEDLQPLQHTGRLMSSLKSVIEEF